MLAKRLPAAERRLQIAASALEILATQGVGGLTSRAIAARVGVRDGSLFRHFASKEAIVDAAIDAFELQMAGTFPEPGSDPLETLSEFFHRRLVLARQRPEFLRLALSDRLTEVAGREGAARVRAVVKRSIEFIREHLTRARQQQVVRDDVPIEVLVWTFTGVLHGAAGASPAPNSRRRSGRLDPTSAWRSLRRLLTTKDHGNDPSNP